jgi:HNH endonuclease/AP2 domain
VKRRPRLTRARLRELLDYNKKTGEFRWRKRPGGGARSDLSAGHVESHQGRRRIGIDGRVYSAHQLAWFYVTGRWGKPMIDHRDGDGTNNRLNNLRPATRSQNNANRRRPRDNTSGYKGVSLHRRPGKWLATIGRNGKRIYLGTFATPQEAHEAYRKEARKLFGKFARAE